MLTKQEADRLVHRGDRAEIKQAHDQLRADLRGQRVTAEQAAEASEALALLSSALKSEQDNSLVARTERVRRGLAGDGDGSREDARARARVVRERMNGR